MAPNTLTKMGKKYKSQRAKEQDGKKIIFRNKSIVSHFSSPFPYLEATGNLNRGLVEPIAHHL